MPISRTEFLRAAQILGLPPSGEFNAADVQSQYRKVMQDWHPDHNPNLRDETNAYAQSINAAKDLLLQWIRENKPDPQAGREEHRQDKASGQQAPPRNDAPSGARAQPSAQPGSGRTQAIKDRLFSFYWRAGFLPHWRILFVPLAIAIVMILFAPSGTEVSRRDAGAVPRPLASAPIVHTGPEVSTTSLGWTVIKYSDVPPAFMPDLGALTSRYPLPLTVVMAGEGVGALKEILVQKIDRTYELGRISAYPDKVRDPIFADVKSVISQGGAILECRYETGQRVGQFKIYYYWYQFRPPEADPAHARALAADHPFLRLRAPLYNCPPSMRRAEDTSL